MTRPRPTKRDLGVMVLCGVVVSGIPSLQQLAVDRIWLARAGITIVAAMVVLLTWWMARGRPELRFTRGPVFGVAAMAIFILGLLPLLLTP
jgi:hypothetical protein